MPPRKQSDLTIPIDRDKLPPISHKDLSALGVDVEAPEVKALLERRERQQAITLESCPVCCGAGMLHPEKVAAFLAAHPEYLK